MKHGFLNRWLRKFFVRTFLSYIIVIAMVFILIYLFSQSPIRNFYTKNLKTRLTQVGHSFIPNAVELYDKGDINTLDQLVKHLGKTIDIRITVIEPDGAVVADSQNDPTQMENHGHRPEVLLAMKGSIGDSTRFSSTMGEQMLYLAMPVNEKGETRLVLRLSIYMKEVKQLMSQLKGKFTGLLLLLALFTLAIAWQFSRGISRPVQQIMAAMRKFTDGDFDARTFLDQNDELGDMALSFNKMADQQKNLFNKLTGSRTQLQAIISSMKEGLMVVDTQGKIVLCNESFEQLVGKSDIIGSSYWEVLRIPDFEDYVKTAFTDEIKAYEKIEMDNKSFLVGFNPMEKREKLVIIFRDITDFQQLETMKKDFVVNLTHELKTPLTAIKGFVETLEEVEDIQHTEYMDIIKRHTHRMTQIVSDLLILSELEKLGENKENITFERVNLQEMIHHISQIYTVKIKEKSLDMIIDVPDNLPDLMGERFKLEQLFINLIDNAVKYTEKGKISIIVTGPHTGLNDNNGDKGDMLEIIIQNNGLPIPEKSLHRLFERFYVVDKSRSRKMGGTGLGLSIVKHVVKIHNGEISVTSNKEKTSFIIKLPFQQ
jgi:two-component system, OmpR family, phosphate regulon sensor histidine kinase PhoR